MGIKISREKPKNRLLSLIYILEKILPISDKAKFKLFLNLEWIFNRLSHELSFKYYSTEEHPILHYTKIFMLENINNTDVVLDLGCNLGDISFTIAEKAKEVTGIDINKEAINIANKRYNKSNLKFYNKEAREFLKEAPIKFNVLILSHILEHLDNPKAFISDFKDGFEKIYIEVPDFDRYYLNKYRQDLNLPLIYTDNDHVSEFDRDEIKSLLKECNIEVNKEEYRYGVQKLWCKVNNNNSV